MAEQLYSAEEAAQVLGLQVRTVRNYVREGRLPGVRIGKQYRIARADLEAFTAGLGARDAAGEGRQPDRASDAAAAAEVSSVVQLEGIGAREAETLERTLVAASLAAGGPGASALRVEPIYDVERGRLRLIIVGPLTEVADLLRIIGAFTAEPGSRGVF